jgi:hypothetical protein
MLNKITKFCKVDRNSVRNLQLDQPYTDLYVKKQNYGGNLSKNNNPGGCGLEMDGNRSRGTLLGYKALP